MNIKSELVHLRYIGCVGQHPNTCRAPSTARMTSSCHLHELIWMLPMSWAQLLLRGVEQLDLSTKDSVW